MADSIADLLRNRDFEEPPEVRVIKDFIRKRFDADAQVTVQPRQIIIGVKGAALAGALRMHLHELKRLCATDKRLVIRIGS
jgi:hypothetical protein